MDKFARARLEKLADNLGFQRGLLLSGIILQFLLTIWFATWLGRTAYDKPVPDWLKGGGMFINILLLTVTIFLLIIFDKTKGAKEDLRELIKEKQQQADLLNLLKPMMSDAFSLDPDRIKPALVERIIESIISEIKTDKSAVSRNFLQRQPEAVKELVRRRCMANLKSRQKELESLFHSAQQADQLVPIHEIKILTDAMDEIHWILKLIPKESDLPNFGFGVA
jgi:hypothetical protein